MKLLGTEIAENVYEEIFLWRPLWKTTFTFDLNIRYAGFHHYEAVVESILRGIGYFEAKKGSDNKANWDMRPGNEWPYSVHCHMVYQCGWNDELEQSGYCANPYNKKRFGIII